MSQSTPASPDAGEDAGEDVVGRAGRAPWSRRRWGVVALVLALLVAAAWLVDHQRRQAEEAALAHCRADGVRALAAMAVEVGAAADFARPSLAFMTSEQSRDGLLAPLGRAAAQVRPGLAAAASACARVEVWSVHDDLRRRRAAYTDHLDAEAARLARVTAEPAQWFDDPPALRDEREALFG